MKRQRFDRMDVPKTDMNMEELYECFYDCCHRVSVCQLTLLALTKSDKMFTQ